MALNIPPKAATATTSYVYPVALNDGDAIESYVLTPTGCTIASDEQINDGIEMFVSGGTAGTTASILVTVVTDLGETLVETLYLPIYGSAAVALATANDVCSYALRKIVGNGETPTAEELADALERLNDMLAAWVAQGADVGATFPIIATTVLYVPDAFLGAIKANLLLAVHDHYGEPVTAMQDSAARRGLQLVKNAKLPDEREGEDYF